MLNEKIVTCWSKFGVARLALSSTKLSCLQHLNNHRDYSCIYRCQRCPFFKTKKDTGLSRKLAIYIGCPTVLSK